MEGREREEEGSDTKTSRCTGGAFSSIILSIHLFSLSYPVLSPSFFHSVMSELPWEQGLVGVMMVRAEELGEDQVDCNVNSHVPTSLTESVILSKVRLLSSHAIVSELTYGQSLVVVVPV